MREDVLQYLKDNLYLVSTGNSTIITNKFKRDVGARVNESKNSNSKQSTRIPSTIVSGLIDYKSLYKQFIVDAEVPSKIPTTNGGFYWANRFSESGLKAFEKVWKDDKVDKKILLAATKYYYKQEGSTRKMIGNYFSDGIWESCYDDIKKVVIAKGLIPDNIIDPDKDKGRNSLRL